MKSKIIWLLAILFTIVSFAQNSETEKPETNNEIVITNETEPIPFQLVEVPPLAPKCKANGKVEKQRKCTSSFITGYINRKLNIDLASELGLKGLIRINVQFIIDKEGKSKNITTSGDIEIMNQNAVEVIQSLPQLTPAMQNGEIVEVSYRLPILFQI